MTSPTHSNKRTTAALVVPVAPAIPAPTPLVEEIPAHGGDEAAAAVIATPTKMATTPRAKAPPKGRKAPVTVIAEDPFAAASSDE